MDEVVGDVPDSVQIHVILDNYCADKRCDEWLSKHRNVEFHYIPASASG
jgi:hypothetical protein